MNAQRESAVFGSILGGSKIAEYELDNMQAHMMVKNGISHKKVLRLKEKTGMDYGKLAHIMGLTRQTLNNKNEDDVYGVRESDSILRVADLYSFGYNVFNSKEKFNQWMNTVNLSLGGVKPVDMLNSSFGIKEVKNLVGKIAYGVY